MKRRWLMTLCLIVAVVIVVFHVPELCRRWRDRFSLQMYFAVRDGNFNLVEQLVRKHPRLVNSQTGRARSTPLHLAAEAGNEEIAQLLLDRGAEVDRKDRFGRTPLYSAAQFGMEEHCRVAELLIRRWADVRARTQFGRTPLHAAAGQGSEKMALLLLAHGALVDDRNDWGETPLHKAAANGHVAVVALLLRKGADVDAKDRMGRRPLQLAKRHPEVVELLEKKGKEQ